MQIEASSARMATKPNTFRVYLNEEQTALLKEACARTELGQSELLSKVAIAALRSIQENNYRLSLPLRFNMSTEPQSEKPLRFADPPVKTRK